MIINHNLMAMNTHRQLAVNQTNASKSMERLSSGMRINRAGDDAAGLAISEKMRGQIRGLKQAQRNAQDGISLIQTAEGALNEIHAILQRMRELATQSATDTNTEVDRGEIQKEIDQLAAEITRIADTTEFNTQNLLGGQFKAKFHIGANQGQNVDLAINDMSSAALGVEGNNGLIQEDVTNATAINLSGTAVKDLAVGDKLQVQKLGQTQTVSTVSDVQYVLRDDKDNVVAVSQDGATYSFVQDGQSLTSNLSEVALGSAVSINFSSDDNFTAIKSGVVEITGLGGATDGSAISFKADNTLVDNPELASGTYTLSNSVPLPGSASLALLDASGQAVAYGTGNLWKDTAGNALFDGNPVVMGVAGDKVIVGGSGIDVSTRAAADKAITIINDALETVSAERSKLGAMQNRLEHTIANLGTSAENLQAAEARIRDLDMAEEIMAFTKNNILQQAATAMLAQANMAPQSVLQLLG
jgi:flagellin